MGDRITVELRQTDYEGSAHSLYLYSHWGGYWMVAEGGLREAIEAARGRWSDKGYCLRIIVDQLTKFNRDKTTGAGLYLTPGTENEYREVIVDTGARTVSVGDATWGFEAFCEMDDDVIEQAARRRMLAW